MPGRGVLDRCHPGCPGVGSSKRRAGRPLRRVPRGLMLLCAAFLLMRAPSVLAGDQAGAPQATPAGNPDQDVAALLLKVERQIVDGHTVSPASDNAVETWQVVTERAIPASPQTLRALTDFATHVRDRAASEMAAGHPTASLDFTVFADLATSLLGRSDVAAPRARETARATASLPDPGPASGPTGVASGPVPPADPAAPETPSVGRGAAVSPMAPAAGPAPQAPTEQALAMAAQYASRGDQLLAIKDITAARRFYEYAADAGSARAAAALARTFDPTFFPQLGVIGLRPDPALAAIWYRRAAALGDRDAEARLQRLRAAAAQ